MRLDEAQQFLLELSDNAPEDYKFSITLKDEKIILDFTGGAGKHFICFILMYFQVY